MIHVIFIPEVEYYLSDLAEILYQKGYFGFHESSVNYVNSIILEIEQTVYRVSRKPAPPYFARYGQDLQYITIRKSRTTQWYVFFTVYLDKYYSIRYITNNHVAAQYL